MEAKERISNSNIESTNAASTCADDGTTHNAHPAQPRRRKPRRRKGSLPPAFAGVVSQLSNVCRAKLEAPAVENSSSWQRELSRSMSTFSEGKYQYIIERPKFRSPEECSPLPSQKTNSNAQGQTIDIVESFEELGFKVWDACICMSKFFERHPELVVGKRVLECGAGTGLLGIVIQHLGADAVLCTEYFRCVEWLQKNIDLNKCRHPDAGSLSACMLDWNLELPQEVQDFAPDLILAVDITLSCRDVPNIIGLLRKLSAAAPKAKILISCNTQREATQMFLDNVGAYFGVDMLDPSNLHPDFISERIFLLWLHPPAAAPGATIQSASEEDNEVLSTTIASN